LTPSIIRTQDRQSVLRFLRYLIEAFERGEVTSYSSYFEVTGAGRHTVVTDDPAGLGFDLSDLEGKP
jgi:hypothetical protein